MREKVFLFDTLYWNGISNSESVSKPLTKPMQQNTAIWNIQQSNWFWFLPYTLTVNKHKWELGSYENAVRALYWPRNHRFCQRNENKNCKQAGLSMVSRMSHTWYPTQRVTCRPENSKRDKSKKHVLWIQRTVYMSKYVNWLGSQLATHNCRVLGCILYTKTGVVKTICFLVSGQPGPTALLCDQQRTVLNCDATHKASRINKTKLTICVLSQLSPWRVTYFWPV